MTAKLYGHRDFVQTNCPGDRYREWVPQLRGLIIPPEEDDMNKQETLELFQAYVQGREGNFAADVRSAENLPGEDSTMPEIAMWEGVKRNVRATATARVSRHTTRVPHGDGVSLAAVKDEIDKAKVRAER